ncbi:Hypothetical predicted protein [Mytilus galloprovincialis]|uniref:Chitin-binding type-2 domain-containing protein n=1 Tax=Mytilus galloprovincialis TaxID=29158 RepID=A0A8B6D1Y7_MYTGA|nr:Hypothetical predicted protein [Mytilus galloprovincialis]
MLSLRSILVLLIIGLVSSEQCSTTVNEIQNANFGNTKLDLDSYRDIVQTLSEVKQATVRMKQKIHKIYTVSCPMEPCQNGGTCVNDTCLCNDGFAGSQCEIDVNKTCQCDSNALIPHPHKCQLYYNCSQAVSPLPTENRLYPHIPQVLRPAYLHECSYPKLFSTTTMSCQNYKDVDCGSRHETKNKCDYLTVSYNCLGACKDCIYFTPHCIGFTDGIYRNKYVAPPGEIYFECRDERNIYGGANPCTANMAPHHGKCRDLYEIPSSYWGVGYGVDCSGRPNGNYKSERMRKCNIYYTCVNGNSTLSHCDVGKVFDTKSAFCQNPANACNPCGTIYNGC